MTRSDEVGLGDAEARAYPSQRYTPVLTGLSLHHPTFVFAWSASVIFENFHSKNSSVYQVILACRPPVVD